MPRMIPPEYAALRDRQSWTGLGITLYQLDEIPHVEIPAKPSRGFRKSWMIVGREHFCGDPIVIDLSRSSHRMGTVSAARTKRWEMIPFAPSIAAFFEALELVQGVVEGRLDPALALREIADKVRGKGMDVHFWSDLLRSGGA